MQKRALPSYIHISSLCLPLVPFFYLLALALLEKLGPDPGKELVHSVGLWALRFLLLTLAITPLNRFTSWQWLPLRRRFGLYALAYACLHLLCYAFFYLGFDMSQLAKELVKRPYIVVGVAALLMLMALGITSTRGWQRRLGRRWKMLHRLVYVATLLVIVHFAWQVKSGFGHAPWYALILAGLLLARWIPRTDRS